MKILKHFYVNLHNGNIFNFLYQRGYHRIMCNILETKNTIHFFGVTSNAN